MKQRLLHMRYWACTCLVSAEEAGGVGGGGGGWCWEGRVREARTTLKVLEAKRREGWSG